MTGARHNLKRWAVCLLLLGACNQERNKSIEAMNQGVEAGRQKLHDRAISHLQQAIAIDPTNEQAHYNLGVVYKDQKKWNEAASAFEQAVKYASDSPTYHYELASALQEAKKLEPAKLEFETTVKLEPKHFKAHYRLGMVLEYLEKFKEADAAYRKAIEVNSRFIPPYIRLGNLYLDFDYDKEAAGVFQAAVTANDGDADAHYGYGVALQKTKQYDEAVKEFKRSLELNGDMFMAVYNLGMTYKLMDDKKNAVEWLRRFQTAGSRGGPELAKAAGDALNQLEAP